MLLLGPQTQSDAIRFVVNFQYVHQQIHDEDPDSHRDQNRQIIADTTRQKTQTRRSPVRELREHRRSRRLGTSVEQERLRGCALALDKIAKTYAHEPEPLLGGKPSAFAKIECDAGELLAGMRRRSWRVTASQDFEVTGLKF